ncbi:hypothetical protein BB559_001994 [Furculomyces boomerangus]|uniref:Uncharacterized protein n=1 Tax=Furculomyces boomerangus TaxID=61424 RepID=A0A2T9YZ27_9FUNG|nr:hypothetical protein BB559_001994 [Furculomyces boomerangus]
MFKSHHAYRFPIQKTSPMFALITKTKPPIHSPLSTHHNPLITIPLQFKSKIHPLIVNRSFLQKLPITPTNHKQIFHRNYSKKITDWTTFEKETKTFLTQYNHRIENTQQSDSKTNQNKPLESFTLDFYSTLTTFCNNKSFLYSHRKQAVDLAQVVFLANEHTLVKGHSLWILEKHLRCMSTFSYPKGMKYVYDWMVFLNYIPRINIYRLWLRGLIGYEEYTNIFQINYTKEPPIHKLNKKTNLNILNNLIKLLSWRNFLRIFYRVFIPQIKPNTNGNFKAITIAKTGIKQINRRRIFVKILKLALLSAIGMQMVKIGIIWSEGGEIYVGKEYRTPVALTMMLLHGAAAIYIIRYIDKLRFNPSKGVKSLIPQNMSFTTKETHKYKSHSKLDNSFKIKNSTKKYSMTGSDQYKNYNSSLNLRINSYNRTLHQNKTAHKPQPNDLSEYLIKNYEKEKSNPIHKSNPKWLPLQISTIKNLLKTPFSSIDASFTKIFQKIIYLKNSEELLIDIKSDMIRIWMNEITKAKNIPIILDDFFEFFYPKKHTHQTKKPETKNNTAKSDHLNIQNINPIYCEFSELAEFSKWIALNASFDQITTWISLLKTSKCFSVDGNPHKSLNNNFAKSLALSIIFMEILTFRPQKQMDKSTDNFILYTINSILENHSNLIVSKQLLYSVFKFSEKYNQPQVSHIAMNSFCNFSENLSIQDSKMLDEYTKSLESSPLFQNFKLSETFKINDSQANKKDFKNSLHVWPFFSNLISKKQDLNYLLPPFSTLNTQKSNKLEILDQNNQDNNYHLIGYWLVRLLDSKVLNWENLIQITEMILNKTFINYCNQTHEPETQNGIIYEENKRKLLEMIFSTSCCILSPFINNCTFQPLYLKSKDKPIQRNDANLNIKHKQVLNKTNTTDFKMKETHENIHILSEIMNRVITFHIAHVFKTNFSGEHINTSFSYYLNLSKTKKFLDITNYLNISNIKYTLEYLEKVISICIESYSPKNHRDDIFLATAWLYYTCSSCLIAASELLGEADANFKKNLNVQLLDFPVTGKLINEYFFARKPEYINTEYQQKKSKFTETFLNSTLEMFLHLASIDTSQQVSSMFGFSSVDEDGNIDEYQNPLLFADKLTSSVPIGIDALFNAFELLKHVENHPTCIISKSNLDLLFITANKHDIDATEIVKRHINVLERRSKVKNIQGLLKTLY